MDDFQKILWAHVEACDIPIHTSRLMLIREHGQRELTWTSTQSICEIKRAPLFLDPVPALLSFQFETGSDLAQALSNEYDCYVRESDNAETNYDIAIEKLTEQFGPGTDASVSNTMSTRWSQNHASLTATIYPADRNDFGNNNRHKLVPGSATECSIHIKTGFFIPIQDFESDTLELFEPIQVPSDSNITFTNDTRTTRYVASPHPDIACGFDVAMTYFFLLNHDLAKVIPVAGIKAIHRVTLLPARGSGGESLAFEVEWSNRADSREYFVRHNSAHGLKSLAEKLADKLGVPIVEHEELDC